jgi:hypothetical protein
VIEWEGEWVGGREVGVIRGGIAGRQATVSDSKREREWKGGTAGDSETVEPDKKERQKERGQRKTCESISD